MAAAETCQTDWRWAFVFSRGGIWLSFWSFIENKGSNWVRFVFDFGFVQGSPSSSGRCKQSGLFRFRVTFRDIRPVRNRPKGYVFGDPTSRYPTRAEDSMAAELGEPIGVGCLFSVWRRGRETRDRRSRRGGE